MVAGGALQLVQHIGGGGEMKPIFRHLRQVHRMLEVGLRFGHRPQQGRCQVNPVGGECIYGYYPAHSPTTAQLRARYRQSGE